MRKSAFAILLTVASFQVFAQTDCTITYRLTADRFFQDTYKNVGDSFDFRTRMYHFEYSYSNETKLSKLKITHNPSGEKREIESPLDYSRVEYFGEQFDFAQLACEKKSSLPDWPIHPIEPSDPIFPF